MIQHRDYSHKSTDYFQMTQHDLLDFIPPGDHIILDIGCAEGFTGKALKESHRAKEVHGIELVPDVAERAKAQLDSVISGNLETMEFPFQPQTFDYIIATEVLEHLINPSHVLQKLFPLLRPSGHVIASVPNIRHLRVIWHLVIQGDWRYRDSGPFDRTHLRIFTKTSFKRLFEENGYEVRQMRPALLKKAQILNQLSLGILEEFWAFRYYCIARKNDA